MGSHALPLASSRAAFRCPELSDGRAGRINRKQKGSRFPESPLNEFPGDVLLSHAVYREVPSGLKGLTAMFGMGTGVAPSLKPPGKPVLQKNAPAGFPRRWIKRVVGRSFSIRALNILWSSLTAD